MVVFGSVIYSKAICYFDDFIKSINNQSYKDFDVLIINDDVDEIELNTLINKIEANKVIVVNKDIEHRTSSELRVDLLIEAKKREYNLLILGDCDDTFDNKRFENVVKKFETNPNYAFFYNGLVLMNGNEAISSMPKETKIIDDILQYNYLGLSNNSINLDKLTVKWMTSLYDCNTFVFDWYLFSRILLLNEKGCYVNNANTIYRIYDNNFAGINRVDKEYIEKELLVKKKHYHLLSSYSNKASILYERIKNLSSKDICVQNDSSFWWSNIKL